MGQLLACTAQGGEVLLINLVRVLANEAFTLTRQRGDHMYFTKACSQRPVVVPRLRCGFRSSSSRTHSARRKSAVTVTSRFLKRSSWFQEALSERMTLARFFYRASPCPRTHGALGAVLGIADQVHPPCRLAASREFGENHIAAQRKQGGAKAVAGAGGTRDARTWGQHSLGCIRA
jgi:hypothetical protein